MPGVLMQCCMCHPLHIAHQSSKKAVEMVLCFRPVIDCHSGSTVHSRSPPELEPKKMNKRHQHCFAIVTEIDACLKYFTTAVS